ncbi:MAG TPA: 4-coumarate--CoA ligase, partial [Curvibacter sp.]|nr:4-coumarate--CoA ligase [Curvibacter sp.]
MSVDAELVAPFGTIAGLIRLHAAQAPQRRALAQDGQTLSYAALDALMDRVAAALQRDGVQPGEAIALCAGTSIAYAVTYLGALRAGVVVAPLAPGATAESLEGMVRDAGARLLFTDREVAQALGPRTATVPRILLDEGTGGLGWQAWLAPLGARVPDAEVDADWPFNII